MSEKKNQFIFIIGAIIILLWLFLKPKKEGNGTSGHVSLEVIPVGSISHSSPEVYESVIIKVIGIADKGIPAPSMELSLKIDGVWLPREMMKIIPVVELGVNYYLEVAYGVAGDHVVSGAMRLNNPVGEWFGESGAIGFTIGQAPSGWVDIGL